MIKFDIEEVLLMHKLIIKEIGGTDGVRDYGLLDSAVNSAFQTFGGQDLYPSLQEKAARLGYSLITNHAFLDGNKRIGMLVMLSFLEINGCEMNYTNDDIINIGLSVACGQQDYNDVLNWINNHKLANENIL